MHVCDVNAILVHVEVKSLAIRLGSVLERVVEERFVAYWSENVISRLLVCMGCLFSLPLVVDNPRFPPLSHVLEVVAASSETVADIEKEESFGIIKALEGHSKRTVTADNLVSDMHVLVVLLFRGSVFDFHESNIV